MAEKKKGVRRIHSLDREQKEIDQPLRSAGDSPPVGRIYPEKVKAVPAANVQKVKKAEPKRKTEPARAEAKRPETRNRPAAKPRTQGDARKQTANGNKQGQKTATPAEKKPPVMNNTAAVERKPAVKKNTAAAPKRKTGRKKSANKPAIRAYFLGGLNEIGKNFTLFECEDDMVIIDCGMAFPDDDMLGIDSVIPDFTFVEKNADKIRAIVITHGHEDHIGGLPYLLKRIHVPVYGTSLTIGLISNKLKEHNLTKTTKMNVCHAGDHLKFGCLNIELIHVNHSVSDAVAVAIHSPAGVLVHTGDFKIDCTPVDGEMIDLARFAELGKQGVLALLMDSTNSERPGYTQSEQMVNNTMLNLFQKAEGKRIIVATFASNISRVQQIINCAQKFGRKVALSGRSMLNVMGIATELGYLHVPEGLLIDLNMINRYDNSELVLITTGSQGEPMSALTRMAFSDHRQVEVNSGDFIILSARPIPGNEKMVGAVVNELMRKECTVIYESMYEVHVSGHACQEELKIIQSLVKPKFFIPVHGEQKHLRKNASLAVALGMDPKNIFIGDIGNTLELHEDYMKQLADVPAGDVMVDGLGVGDVGSVVMRDRKHLGEDGIIIAVCSIESASGHVASGPDIVSRGFVYVRENEKLMDEAQELVYNTLEACANDGTRDWSGLKQKVKEDLSRFLYRKTRRSPMVLPIIMEV